MIKKSYLLKVISAVREQNAVLRKVASSTLNKTRGKRSLRREYSKLRANAYETALEIEEQCQRAICADDIVKLSEIVCRTTNSAQDTLLDIFELLEIEISE